MPPGKARGTEIRYPGMVGMTRVDRLLQQAQRLPFLGPRTRSRAILPLATAALLVCAAVVIAVAVLPRVDPLAGGTTDIPLVPRLGPAATNLLLALVVFGTLGLGAVAMAYLIVALRNSRIRYLAGNAAPWRIILILVVGMLLFYLAVALVLSLLVLPDEEMQRPPVPEGDGEAEEEDELEEPEPEPPEDGLTAATRARRSRVILLTLLAAGFAAVAYFAVRLMRATPENEPEEERLSEELRRDLAKATELAIAELEADPDFRRAVIGCWAYLELALARHEHPRSHHHTPLEYVRVLVVELPALPARALLELTGRYEVARFSEHAVTRDDRDTALRCLHDIRHRLSTA